MTSAEKLINFKGTSNALYAYPSTFSDRILKARSHLVSWIQAGLAVSKPEDASEREAERAAGEVMGMRGPKGRAAQETHAHSQIQRSKPDHAAKTALLHELVEQREKQLGTTAAQRAYGSPTTGAHGKGLAVELAMISATAGSCMDDPTAPSERSRK